MADMRLAMVVSLVDKLTAPAKKVIATVKGVGGKFDDTARMAKDASGALRGVADGLDDAAQDLIRFGQSAHCRALCHNLSGTTQEQCVPSGSQPLRRGHNCCLEATIRRISMQPSPQTPHSAIIILPLLLLHAYSDLP